LYSSSPVTAVGQQEMKFEGTSSVETLINNLPQSFADFGQNASNGATGTATVNLRGLGSARTLVLIDGRRLLPGDISFPVPDLNQIPAALVDHVEVLTGGASAVYGSDAEAGVVNFVMRKDFEGVEVDGQYTVNQAGNDNSDFNNWNKATGFPSAPSGWWGGETDDATLILGVNTPNGKGNVTAYLGFRNSQPVLESKRNFSACSLSARPTNGVFDHLACAGSSNYNRWISLDDYYAGAAYDFFEQGSGAAGSGNFTDYTGAPNQKFNYGPLNYLQRPDTRYTGGFFAHYEVAPQLDLYSQFMFTDDHSVAQIAQGGSFLGTYFTMNCDNPLMTDQERTALCSNNAQGAGCTPIGNTGNCNINPGLAFISVGRRDLEGGFRTTDLRHTAYRMVIGAKGDLGSGWSYDIYAQYGTTVFDQIQRGNWSQQRLQNALNVDPATGQCFVAENGMDPTCVPLDIFNGFGSVTPKMLDYVQATSLITGYTEEQVVSGSLAGDLGSWGLQSPWAKNPVGVALGGEYRAEYLQLDPSHDLIIGDIAGNGGKTLPVPRSGFNVSEGFGEVRVPLVQGMPFVEDLSVNAGYRYSSYDVAGSVTSYKYGAEWQPIDDFRLRASYQRAVRAPNVLELFAPNNEVLFGGQDPCAATGGDPTVIHNCLTAGGIAHAQVPNPDAGILTCPAAQCNNVVGGNISLVPEVSDTRSVGLVLTPTFLSGFTATIDYFSIKVAGYMPANGETGLPSNVILAACYGDAATPASQSIACPLVFRDPGNHSIHTLNGFVQDVATNAGAMRTSGFDFEANYQVDLGDWVGPYGSLSANFVGTKLDKLQFTPIPGYLSYDCAGLFGVTCGTPSPEWRHKLRVTWTSPWDFDFSVNWRHLSSVSLDQNSSQALLAGPQDLVDGNIGSFDYFDLAVNWNVREGVSLHAGVNNVFDKDPPVVDSNTFGISAPPFGNGNTYPGVYDSLGRTIFVGATIKY
ncbi:MAG: TonB-dependent receptor, partial [Alphaproteobacteria bacterium]|nr:TonB-dependent receptor [Alphaproteobacteria bacterium]